MKRAVLNWNWRNNHHAVGANCRAHRPRGENRDRGGALVWVLAVLGIALTGLTFLWQRQKAPTAFLVRERDHRQALYLAESGIALQLHRIRFFDQLTGPVPPNRARQAMDTIRFFLDSTAAKPEVEMERGRGFLEIRSQGQGGKDAVSIRVRFGRALDPDMFGPALTLDNDRPLAQFPSGQIRGALRLHQASPGIKSLPWPERLQIVGYAESFAGDKFRNLETELQALLSAEGGESGNGDFTSTFPPPIAKKPKIGFPLGEVTLRHDGGTYWEITGPAVIASQGDIRVRGKVLLKDITLLSRQDIYFEGEARAENSTLMSTRHLYVQDQSRFEGLLASGGNLFLRDRAAVEGNSVVMRVGGGSGDTSMALRLEGEATVRGFVISTGVPGRVILSGRRNRVTGVILAAEVWLGGLVEGSVVANRLRCHGPGNCLGEGIIDREALPADFAQPWELGNSDRSRLDFQLLSWEIR